MIEINNLTTIKIDEEFLKNIVKKILEEKKKELNLSIALIGPNRMKKLNKRYRGKNRVTDVLAFPNQDSEEIVICLREVKKNAKKFNSTFKKELTKVLIHGVLHLLGYDHEKGEREREEMEKEENYYLLQLEKYENTSGDRNYYSKTKRE